MDQDELVTQMSPAEAAAGELDEIDVDRWSLLAAYWLAAGYDSAALVELAALTAGDTVQARELMPQTLAELGHPIVTVAEFAPRCQRMLDIIQRDLDATGYGQYRMHPVNAYPPDSVTIRMYAALPGGAFWSGGSLGMQPGQQDLELLEAAATSVCDTLLEVLHVSWPGCPQDAGYPMAPEFIGEYTPPIRERGEALAWYCQPGQHYSAPIGHLGDARRPNRGK